MATAKTAASRSRVLRILVADDDPLVRAAVGVLLTSGPYQLIGEATDGAETIQLVQRLKPDVLLLDLNMPKKAGLEALREIGDKLAGMRTIVLTVGIEKRQVLEALQLGARGIVLKSAARTLLTACLKAVQAGKYWVNNEPVADVKHIVHDLAVAVERERPETSPKLKLLSPKEAQIVRLIVEGRTNKDIAGELNTSEQVVKNHLGKIFDKLGVFNRLELALYALDNRLAERA
ncbi:MAG: response regulator transcription factor [Acidobacteriales bacterium]|nr:response regulator transcription factor [Terriglobales bacterium]